VDDPYAALAAALEIFHPAQRPEPGVSPAADIDHSARIGEAVTAAPGARVGPECEVGDGSVLHPGVVLQERCRVGRDCVLHPNVVLYADTVLGDRVVIHGGSVLGSDGFGYALTPEGHRKVPQVGRVVVEDDVEIGANVTVDRATLGETLIGRGTKVDNLVQIAHNVRVGPGSILVGQVGISGSTRLGSGVVFAGQSGAAGHLEVGDGARVGAKSAVFSDVPPGETVTGIPAVGHSLWRRIATALPRLPEILRRLRRLEKASGLAGPNDEKESS
jgi:UDP-3-O-[3-hydroxymyristoyl] glucosamine N-acyltransferase